MHLLSNHIVRKALIGIGSLAILLAVLFMYLRPEFLRTLADQVWGCF